MAGLIFLVMSFNWEGYLMSENDDEFLYIGDQHLVFSSADACRMKEAADLVSTFQLKIIKDIREAWTEN